MLIFVIMKRIIVLLHRLFFFKYCHKKPTNIPLALKNFPIIHLEQYSCAYKKNFKVFHQRLILLAYFL